jgi:hypothetical protein
MRDLPQAGNDRRRRILALGVVAVALALAPGQALATALGASALGELTGSRDVALDGGLQGFNEWDNGLFTIEWEITLGPTSAHYEYTFTGLSGKDISNIVLDLSDDCAWDPLCAQNVMINGSTTGVETQFGNFAGILGGLKLEGVDGMEGAVYEFDSNRLPVYGHLAVKDGGGPETCADPNGTNIVCSNQLLGIGDPDAIVNFIAVPNGVVPEPGTGLLLGLGLIGLAVSRRGSVRAER